MVSTTKGDLKDMFSKRVQFLRKIARVLKRSRLTFWLARICWKNMSGHCDWCGKYAGFNSTICGHGFLCSRCHIAMKEGEEPRSIILRSRRDWIEAEKRRK